MLSAGIIDCFKGNEKENGVTLGWGVQGRKVTPVPAMAGKN